MSLFLFLNSTITVCLSSVKVGRTSLSVQELFVFLHLFRLADPEYQLQMFSLLVSDGGQISGALFGVLVQTHLLIFIPCSYTFLKVDWLFIG